MPDIEVNIDIYCATCGAELCEKTTATTKHDRPAFEVEPCERCLESARDKGYNDGYKDGYSDGGGGC